MRATDAQAKVLIEAGFESSPLSNTHIWKLGTTTLEKIGRDEWRVNYLMIENVPFNNKYARARHHVFLPFGAAVRKAVEMATFYKMTSWLGEAKS